MYQLLVVLLCMIGVFLNQGVNKKNKMNMKFSKPKTSIDKQFHDKLFGHVKAMINISWDYIDNATEGLKIIYVFGSMEGGAYLFDTFYNINSEILQNHQTENQSWEKSSHMMDMGIEKLEDITTLFKKHKKAAPTQIKVEYDFISEELKYDFEYDLIWSNKEEGGLPSDAFDNWVGEIQKNIS